MAQRSSLICGVSNPDFPVRISPINRAMKDRPKNRKKHQKNREEAPKEKTRKRKKKNSEEIDQKESEKKANPETFLSVLSRELFPLFLGSILALSSSWKKGSHLTLKSLFTARQKVISFPLDCPSLSSCS